MKLSRLESLEPWEWPPDARSTILDVLRDAAAKTEERVLAASLAGEIVVVNERVVKTLLQILQNDAEPVDLRATAAIALGPVPSRRRNRCRCRKSWLIRLTTWTTTPPRPFTRRSPWRAPCLASTPTSIERRTQTSWAAVCQTWVVLSAQSR